MDAIVLDTSYNVIGIIDTFESFIWAERYTDVGDFELYILATDDALRMLSIGNYIAINGSDTEMIIEKRTINESATEGAHAIITGRTVGSILDRRIIANRTVLSGNFQDGIEQLLDENVIYPDIVEREIPNFEFKRSADPRITSLTIEAQFNGENLLEAITRMCNNVGVGFRITINNNTMIFELYCGTDRSVNQIKVPPVIFSSQFDNLLESSYAESNKDIKTAAYVEGTEDEEGSYALWVDYGEAYDGLNRRELFVDASTMTRDSYDPSVPDAKIPIEVYEQQLIYKGQLELANYQSSQMIDGKVEARFQYVYGRDFKMGDVVQVSNSFGISTVSQIVEVTRIHDLEGDRVVPTFASSGILM